MILRKIAEKYSAGSEFSALIDAVAAKKPAAVEGVPHSSFPLIVSALYYSLNKQIIAVTPDAQTLRDLRIDLSCFIEDSKIFTLPPWETLPYDFVSPPESIERERVTALYRMIGGTPAVIAASAESIARRVPSKEFLLKRGLVLDAGDDYSFDDVIETFAKYGYTREPRVESYGHFSVKGGIIDIYLPSIENPVRLDFFGDALESIREFDIDSQTSVGKHKSVVVFPRKEIILFEQERKKLQTMIRDGVKKGYAFTDDILARAESGSLSHFRGIEDLFAAVVETAPPLSLAPEDSIVLYLDPIEITTKKNMLEKTYNELYSRRNFRTLCVPPAELLHLESLEPTRANSVTLNPMKTKPDSISLNLKGIVGFQGRIKQAREEIEKEFEAGRRVIVTTGFEGQARRLYDLLAEFKPSSDFESLDPSAQFSIVTAPLQLGLTIPFDETVIISDQDIFGKSYRRKNRFKRKDSRPIDSFIDLAQGDYVVHLNHGIGLFRRIERMTAGGVERDFLVIDYADSDKLYVSLDQITMVQKYIGLEGKAPRVDHLGRKSAWNRIKKRVQDSVDEIARELMKIYSKRSIHKGYQFPPDTMWQEEFESMFEYEETPDQITAIEDVKDDMESAKPMDRLVCGDVGFGKTEVAIRASFKAVMAGRQVAILVPTTVLAMQHHSNFAKRFAGYPIAIDMISRFKSAADIKRTKNSLAEGKTDIVIGTHALLAADMKFKGLGLLIIDEEQKFGVTHKERLKQIKATVDVLTLTATPIPRTLHMAVSGIRDLSVITTPPENRHSIETYVVEDNPEIIRAAILAEINRGGQIFFVHNRVQTIEAQMKSLEELAPEATFRVAHGQMHEHELEEAMIDFLKGDFDVLISTTIIESGLDIPNVNTIIINRADTFGLSQLYQLKGRVGRSGRQAYAYLFYPAHTPLSEEAQKRLNVISEYTELGSGFKVAMKDLEIRGAGNIIGREQSGSIMEVGFDLYTQMLESAVREIKGERRADHYRTPVSLNVDFFIPGEYMPDERQKIEFYKRFESCESPAEVNDLASEMKDRFGQIPFEVINLIELEHIRTLASNLYIEEINEDVKQIKLKFGPESRVDITLLFSFMKKEKRLMIDPRDRDILLFRHGAVDPQKKLGELKKLLQQIS